MHGLLHLVKPKQRLNLLLKVLDMLKLPVPEVDYENVVLKPSEYQKDIVSSLAERAEAVRKKEVAFIHLVQTSKTSS